MGDLDDAEYYWPKGGVIALESGAARVPARSTGSFAREDERIGADLFGADAAAMARRARESPCGG